MPSAEMEKAVKSYEKYIDKVGLKNIELKVVSAYTQAAEASFMIEHDYEYAFKLARKGKQLANQYCWNNAKADIWTLEKYAKEHNENYDVLDFMWRIFKVEGQNKKLDSALLYLEHKRLPKDRFYQPRRKCLQKIGVIDALQSMLDDKLDLLTISLPPGTGKTTMEKMFHALLCGWFVEDYSLFYSHSGDITHMYYEGVLNIISDTLEYAWNELFPDLKITNTNAKLEQFNIGKYKPFPNLQCTSVGAKNAGKVRCNKFLLVDDMVGGIEEALSKPILDKLWDKYTVDARQRKVGECKEIHIATRWSVYDPIGRLQRAYEGNERCKFIAVPDVDAETGESNFKYDINPFTKEFFASQALLMDDISYRCLYKNDPVEREGLLYHEDELRRYLELPLREPDAIWGQGDTKSTGVDDMVFPAFYQYGEDYYMVDTVCDDNSDFAVQEDRIVDLMIRTNMQACEIESNAGGSRLAVNIQAKLKERGGICNITTKATETNKETRIIVNAPWIKQHVLFKDKSLYTPKSDYGKFMTKLCSYSQTARKQHDDVPDCLANFALSQTKITRQRASFEPILNPFRMTRRLT